MRRTGFFGGRLAYQLLRRIGDPSMSRWCSGSAYRDRSKVEALLGPEIWYALHERVVIDFGCGTGRDAIEIAQRGAKKVIGIDIRPTVLELANAAAERAGVSDHCLFCTHTREKVDVIISLDGFEHFEEPAEILRIMRRLVKADGYVDIAFGPTWFHPLGGHGFSVFPWAHLIFTEKSLIRWRSDFKSDGATCFKEVEGGLNQMTIRRFKKLLKKSEFYVERCELVPIRRLRWLSNVLTREFLTAGVRCTLIPRAMPDNALQ